MSQKTGEGEPGSEGRADFRVMRRRITLADGRYMYFYTFEPPRAENEARVDVNAGEARPGAGPVV